MLLIQKQVRKPVRQWRDLLDHLAVRGHLGEYGVECNSAHLRTAAAESGLAEGGREEAVVLSTRRRRIFVTNTEARAWEGRAGLFCAGVCVVC